MSMVLLETCRGLKCNIYYYTVNKLCIKLVIETSLYYDARWENIKVCSWYCSSLRIFLVTKSNPLASSTCFWSNLYLISVYKSSYAYSRGTFKGTMGTKAGRAVVKALRYKPAGRGFDSRWCHWNFSMTQSYRSHYGPGVDSASNRNEYQVYFLGVNSSGT
jgi:hypothetical protein